MDTRLKVSENRKYIDAHARLLVPVLLAIGLSLCCKMCVLHSEVEDNRAKTAVAIVHDR